ncbi:MAG: 4Fe-4S binding protein [Deltaproteobacteria bacterium]|jgi:MinD superfamily P-loop ATPase|nr:4Fe-4S binding protein [Deltaproteobacteria bacterium]
MSEVRKIASIDKECVACGVCVKACPIRAIAVYKGLFAVVDESKCAGCGKCGQICPAGVIAITEAAA